MSNTFNNIVFDYRALRLLMGLIALALPFVVYMVSSTELPSISSSYYTEARDAFVGMLFVVSAFLWAYNGHTRPEAIASKAAALAAIFVAIFPTACTGCAEDLISYTHLAAAVTLFSLLAYFCLGPFRLNTRHASGKKGLRGYIYFACGWTMILCMLTIVIAKFVLDAETVDEWEITFWGEAVALVAFGIAWITAGKYFSFLTDEKEALSLLG
jgi:hypothetical protein